MASTGEKNAVVKSKKGGTSTAPVVSPEIGQLGADYPWWLQGGHHPIQVPGAPPTPDISPAPAGPGGPGLSRMPDPSSPAGGALAASGLQAQPVGAPTQTAGATSPSFAYSGQLPRGTFQVAGVSPRNAVTPQAVQAVGLLQQGYQSPDGKINIAPMSLDAAAHFVGSLQQESYGDLRTSALGDQNPKTGVYEAHGLAGWHDQRWAYAQNFQQTYFPNDPWTGQLFAAANELQTRYPGVYATLNSDAPSQQKSVALSHLYEGALHWQFAPGGDSPARYVNAQQLIAAMPQISVTNPPAAVAANAPSPTPVSATTDAPTGSIPLPRVDPRILAQQATADIPADPTYRGLMGGTYPYTGANAAISANLAGNVPGFNAAQAALQSSATGAYPSQGVKGITGTLTNWFNSLPPDVQAAQAWRFASNPALFNANLGMITDPTQRAQFEGAVRAAQASPYYAANYTNSIVPIIGASQVASADYSSTNDPRFAGVNPNDIANARILGPIISPAPNALPLGGPGTFPVAPLTSQAVINGINPNPYSTAPVAPTQPLLSSMSGGLAPGAPTVQNASFSGNSASAMPASLSLSGGVGSSMPGLGGMNSSTVPPGSVGNTLGNLANALGSMFSSFAPTGFSGPPGGSSFGGSGSSGGDQPSSTGGGFFSNGGFF